MSKTLTEEQFELLTTRGWSTKLHMGGIVRGAIRGPAIDELESMGIVRVVRDAAGNEFWQVTDRGEARIAHRLFATLEQGEPRPEPAPRVRYTVSVVAPRTDGRMRPGARPRLIEANGEAMTADEWAGAFGVSRATICRWIQRGWFEADARTD